MDKTKRSYSCSYCKKQGHNIGNCKEKITNLDQKMIEIGVFDLVLFTFGSIEMLLENKTLLQMELYQLTEKELKILMRVNGETLKLTKSGMMNKLYLIYYFNRIMYGTVSNLNQITQEVKNYPKEKFEKYSRILISHNGGEFSNDIKKIYRKLYPEPIKANIKIISTPRNCNKTKKECPICYDEVNASEQIQTNCNHVYCAGCIEGFLEKEIQKTEDTPCVSCPMCRSEITTLEMSVEKTMSIQKYCVPPAPAEAQPESQSQTPIKTEDYRESGLYSLISNMVGF